MWFTFLPAELPRNHRFELDTSLGFVLLLVVGSDGREQRAAVGAWGEG
jgi:hypothetical protein